jgi:hypothetical protein
MALSRAVKFTEEDTLPGTQNEPPAIYWQCQRVTDQTCLNMGWRITLQVTVASVLGHHCLKLCFNIIDHTGVSMLIYGNPGSGVGHEKIANAALNTTGPDRFGYRSRNFLKIYP